MRALIVALALAPATLLAQQPRALDLGRPTATHAEPFGLIGGLRERQFKAWHARLIADLDALFSDEVSRADETKIRNIFGQAGVDAWKASQPRPEGVFGGLLLNPSAGNPTRPASTGSRNTAG